MPIDAISSIALADLCLRKGRGLIQICQDIKNSASHVESQQLTLNAMWSRTDVQIEFLKKVMRSFEEEHLRIQCEVLEMLSAKLVTAMARINSVIDRSKGSTSPTGELIIKKGKYTFVKNALDEAIAELDRWQRIFDPTWYLILLIGDSVIDTELTAKSVGSSTAQGSQSSSCITTASKLRSSIKGQHVPITLSESGLNWPQAEMVRFSELQIVCRSTSDKRFIVDTVSCESVEDVARVRDDVTRLAETLRDVDPGIFGLLVCHGLVKRRKGPLSSQLQSMSLVFRLPDDTSGTTTGRPCSLREQLPCLSECGLNDVLSIAQQLAQAVSYIHSCNFVHKNIRPEAILLFSSQPLAKPEHRCFHTFDAYLLGFNSFRSVHLQTLKRGDDSWELNLYRHPLRQGAHLRDTYIMQHDVYSLGVCLLELGLRDSFIHYDESEDGRLATSPTTILGLETKDFDVEETLIQSRGWRIKNHLVEMARSLLPRHMGDRYTAVVVTCLTCLDSDNIDFADDKEMRDEDGILIGVKFIETVLFQLNAITL